MKHIINTPLIISVLEYVSNLFQIRFRLNVSKKRNTICKDAGFIVKLIAKEFTIKYGFV